MGIVPLLLRVISSLRYRRPEPEAVHPQGLRTLDLARGLWDLVFGAGGGSENGALVWSLIRSRSLNVSPPPPKTKLQKPEALKGTLKETPKGV